MQHLLRICLFGLIFIAIESPVFAHPFHDHTDLNAANATGFQSGILHPLSGLDHLLAMVAIGILSVQSGGRALWLGPLSFLLGLTGGGLVGLAHFEYGSAELLIALSVIALGLAIAVGKTPPQTIMSIAFAVFGVLHGYAHGIEVPNATQAVGYLIGFVAGSILLHLAGITFGLVAKNRANVVWNDPLRLSGGVITLAGLFLIMQTN